jgi:hypothetical protein
MHHPTNERKTMSTTGNTALSRAMLILNAIKADFAIVTKNEKDEPVLVKSDHMDVHLTKMFREMKVSVSDHVRKHMNFEMVVGEVVFIPDTGSNEIEVVRSVAISLAGKAWGVGSVVTTIVDSTDGKVDIDDKTAKYVELIRVK